LWITGTRGQSRVSGRLQLLAVISGADVVHREDRIVPEGALKSNVILVGINVREIGIKKSIAAASLNFNTLL